MTLFWIFIGGGIGSVCRYAISLGSKQLLDSSFPIGTLVANLLACLILALGVGIFSDKINAEWMKALLLVGFCGGFSTFSTFGLETYHLLKSEQYLWAVLNVVISVLFALALFYFLIKTQKI